MMSGGGASKVTADVANIVAQLPPVVEGISGVSLSEVMKRIPGIGPAFAEADAASAKKADVITANEAMGIPVESPRR